MAYISTQQNGIRYLLLDKLNKGQEIKYVEDCPFGHCIWTEMGLFRKESALTINVARAEFVMVFAEDYLKYKQLQDTFYKRVFHS